MSSSLSVMLAAAGRLELVRRTLDSIAACVKPQSYVETIVIENGRPQGIEEIVRSNPRAHGFRYLYVAEANKSNALNVGLKHASGELVVFTDSDVRVSPGWLTAYASAAQDGTSNRFFGGPVSIDAEHGLPPEWMRRYYPETLAVPWELPNSGSPTVVSGKSFMGTNWAACRDSLLEVGGFDTTLGPGSPLPVGDETEIQARLTARGATPIFVPDARLWHYLHRDYLAPDWLLGRIYKHGVAWGVLKTRAQRPSLWPLIQAGMRCLNVRLHGMVLRLAGGERQRFRASYLERRAAGRWDGLWLGRKWQTQTPGRVL